MAQESWNRDQDETGCHPPEGPVQCANNCGFFGSRTTMNLCSKCYRDTVLVVSQNSKSSSSSSSSRAIRMVEITGPTRISGGDSEAVPVFITPSVAAALAAPPSLAAASSSSGASPSRCFSCRKRVGLTGFKCRCGDVFCSTHRYSDKHDCSFDYKAAGRDSIAKANPVVVASKIEKI